jgi:translation initiation factor IF-3
VPVPRRFDRRPPDRDQTRINDRIRVPEVRLVGEDGKQIGVIKTSEALAYAQERDLDLVEVAPEARPPVCRVLDYSKYKYEQAQKQKAARKHQQQITIREIKFRPKIAQNDYDTKKSHVTRFLLNKDKVKITIMFRGREVTHPERGTALLDRLAGELAEIATVEQMPIQDGRNMTMMLGPSKAVFAGEKDKGHEPESGDSAAPGTADATTPDAVPAADAPKADAPEADAPAADAPKADAPTAVASTADAATAAAASSDAPAPPNGSAAPSNGKASNGGSAKRPAKAAAPSSTDDVG